MKAGGFLGGVVLQGLLAGLGTCLGALIVIACSRLRPGVFSLLLGFASGVMTAVIVFDLLPSSLRYDTPLVTLTGFLGGAGILAALDLGIKILSPQTVTGNGYLRTGYLIAVGIALHDFPEGLAIAAGFAAAGKLGPLLALAIGVHNIPEGMAVSAPLRAGGLSVKRVLALSLLISLITPLGVFTGLMLLENYRTPIGALLAFAAGAMTYIVLAALAPMSRRGNRHLARLGVVAGVLFILALDFIVLE